MKMKGTDMTWEQLKAEKSGTILHDVFEDGIRFIVMRGPCSLCAYVGVPLDHPLAGFPYDDLSVNAHGGLTFASEGDGENGIYRPKDFYWYGWDYSHCGDCPFYHDEMPRLYTGEDKKWLVQDVIEDSWETTEDFKQLVRLAEKIREKNAIKS